MAVKTFTQAEKLTSADTNTYLTNGGLVWITGASFSTATEVLIDSRFSSTYDFYVLIVTELDSNTAGETRVQFRTANSNNGTSNYFDQSTTFTTVTTLARNTVAQTSGILLPNVGAAGWNWQATIYNPFSSTVKTSLVCTGNSDTGSLFLNSAVGFQANTSFDGLRFYRTAGNFTGSYQLMGVRKP
jgi:hypothetical protein